MHHMSLPGLRGANRSLPSKWLILNAVLIAICGIVSQSFAQVMPADGTGANGGGVVPSSYTSSGSYFNRELGTPLRFKYHSEGYGTETGVVSLGTMQVFNLDGAAWFLDGQGTMSEDFGGGFNAGIGYRELASLRSGFDAERILGGSFWTDGQSTKADNFFTQLGFGLESLGESFDLRMNGYFPLDRTKTSDPTLINFDTITFAQNGLFSGLARTTTDTAYSVLDAEFAKRIHDLDAWAVAAVYHLGGGGADDTGYRVGVRGYAVPDLLVGVEVTDDDIYNTNVMASITWFVGRTHTGNAPIGQIVDRFREPVMRNSFIATTSTFTDAGATQLTDADTNDFFDFIHVDSTAAAGGDGSFENPFNNLAEAEARQADGSYVYVHGGSVLAANDPFTLLDNVKFWGEGTNEFGDVVQHVVDTVERGTVTLPETAAGAQDLDSPTINVAAGQNFIELADNNDVNNFEINGGVNAVTGNGVNAPQLANLDINNPTGTGISLTGITGTTVIDNTVTITDANQGMLIDGGLGGMNINARITNSIGNSLTIQNRTGGTIAYGGSIQDDNAVAATADAIVIQDNISSVINFTQVIDDTEVPPLGIDIDSGDFRSLFIDDNQQTTTITFADLRATANNANTIEMLDGGTLTINDSANDSLIRNSGTGDAFNNVGNAGANFDSTITIAANIENEGGGNAVDISGRDAGNVTFNGTIEDTDSLGISLTGNSGGIIAFNEQVTTTTTGSGNGVTITGGSDASYNFTDIDITTNDGIGFLMTHGGILTVVPSANETNTITTTSGQALVLDGTLAGAGDALTIGAADVNFAEINVAGTTADAIVIREVEGAGQVILGSGDDPGDGGTVVTSGAGRGMVIDDATNVVVNNIDFNKTGTEEAILVTNQGTGDTVLATGVRITAAGAGNAAGGLVIEANEDGNNTTFTELVSDTVDGNAVAVQNNTGGTYNFNDLDAATSGTGDAVHIEGNTTDTIVTFNGMDLDATGTGDAFSSEDDVLLAATGDTSVDAVSGRGVAIVGATIGAANAQFDTVNVTAGTSNGVLIQDTIGTGTVTIGSGNTAGDGGTITTAGAGILIDNADNVTITSVTVDNDGTAGNGLVIQNQDGGTVSATRLTTRTAAGTGVLVQNNTGGTNILSTTDVDVVGAGNGVSLTNNTGASTTFAGIDIDATTGTGFNASGGGTVSATGTNTVTTTTGTAVNLNNITSGAGNIGFTSVNTTGAANGVIVDTVTGGSVTIGSAGNASTLNTTGDAIQVINSTLVNINNVDVTGAGGTGLVATHNNGVGYTLNVNDLTVAATKAAGIDSDHTGAGAFVFNLDNSTIGAASVFNHTGTGTYTVDINNTDFTDTVLMDNNGAGNVDLTIGGQSTFTTTAAGDVAFSIVLGTANTTADIRVRNSTISAGDAVAFNFDSNSTNIKTVRFLFDTNTVANNSAADAADFDANGATLLNLTVTNNALNNAGAGISFDTASNSANTVVNLNYNNNNANAFSGTVRLDENLGDFNVQDLATVEARNDQGLFIFDPNQAAFDDIPNVPTPP
jgi:hypothetical protein